MQNEIWLTACHLPDVLNFEAEKSSSLMRELSGSFNLAYFVRLLTPLVLLRLTCLHADLKTSFRNMFLGNLILGPATWMLFRFPEVGSLFTFSSFSLLNRCLQKLQNDQTFSTVDSSRLADTGLVALVTKPSGGKSITAPTRQGPPHPSTIRDSTSPKKPNETDGMSVSGNTMKQDEYRGQLLDCLLHPGEEVLRNNTPGTSKNGQHFVSKGKSIIFSHL